MGILNAFYFPDGDYRDLDSRVTSVNTFRIVFNKYFASKLKRLPDRIYAFPDTSRIYDFYEITDILGDDTVWPGARGSEQHAKPSAPGAGR